MRKRAVFFSMAAMGLLMAGCGVSDHLLDEMQQRINSLSTKGVPDSLLVGAKVYLCQLQGFKRIGVQDQDFRNTVQHLKSALSFADNFYQNHIAALKPSFDSLRALLRQARVSYSGLQLKKFDSLAAIGDSFAGIGWLLQAHENAERLIIAIPAFNADALRAAALRDSIPGAWECVNNAINNEDRELTSRHRKLFTFGKDGSAKFIDAKKGRTDRFLKEDWEFVSSGRWELCGDTVHLFVNRFAAIRQKFEHLNLDDAGRDSAWTKEELPAYDSIITDGTQDRNIAYSDLKSDFKRR